MIRGKKVKTKLISRSLSNTESDSYRPRWLDAAVPVGEISHSSRLLYEGYCERVVRLGKGKREKHFVRVFISLVYM